MDAELAADGRHLPSLSVKGLFGIPELTIPELGRVTLLTGKNGAGKSTVLDAVRIYAARGAYSVLAGVLRSREEIVGFVDADGDEILAPNPEALFYGRNPTPESVIAIGPATGPVERDRTLFIKAGPGLAGGGEPSADANDEADADLPMLEVKFDGQCRGVSAAAVLGGDGGIGRRWPRNRKGDSGALFRCRSQGPNAPGNDDIAQFWDNAALTPGESLGVDALRLAYGDGAQRVAVIGNPRGAYGRRVIVGLAGQDAPAPLRSLGDGAVRMLGVALALANFRGGVLLLDEVENGIHHTVQCDFWKMTLQAACDNDVQVIATTHSWDCVASFARAAAELETPDSRLVTLTQRHGKVFATTLDEDQMQIAARHRIEVR